MNWLKKLVTRIAYNNYSRGGYKGRGGYGGGGRGGYAKKPYTGDPRYFGALRLVTFMGRPTIIGNSMKIRQNLGALGFRWDGNVKIDGTPVGDAPDNVINGAWVGTRQLSPEEVDQLSTMGVDISMQAQAFQPAVAQTQQPQQPENPAVQQPVQQGPKGAQSDQANVEMIMKLRDASSYAETEAVIQEQIQKLITLMTNPTLTEEQKKLKQQFMQFMESAHNYSFFNTILIFMQNRNSTMVGGAKNFWGKKGRKVREGEKPIWVTAPIFASPKLSDEQYARMLAELRAKGMNPQDAKAAITDWKKQNQRLVGYKDVPVYDYAQTDPVAGWTDEQGNPPFDMQAFHQSYRTRANNENEYTTALWRAVNAAAAKDKIQIKQDQTGTAGGWSSGGNIVIDETSAGERRLATTFHEYAHELLHQSAEARAKRIKEQIPKKIIEMEAEATAFLVAQAFDLQGDPEWAARYILLWEATPKDVLDRQKEIHKAYTHIVKAIRSELDAMLPQNVTQAAMIQVIYKIAKMMDGEEWLRTG